MRKIPKPTVDVSLVYDACLSGIGNVDKQSRFVSHKGNVLYAASEYEKKAFDSEIYQIKACDECITVPLVTKDEQKKLYVEQMAKLGRPGRGYYDILRGAARLCPFCGISSVRTLEHYLPKAQYPDLAVVPVNLIPCCRDCNTEKLDAKIDGIEDQNIHPYFDDFTQEQWLFADIIDLYGPSVVFRVKPPAAWSSKSQYKVMNHLTTYSLDERFGDLGNGEIEGVRKEMTDLFDDAGSQAVKTQLEERAASYAERNLNCWQMALYQALANSNYYCQGNFG